MSEQPFNLGRIREALQKKGVTQREVAQELGIPQSAVSNIFNGKRQLKLQEGFRLQDLAGLSFYKPVYKERKVMKVAFEKADQWKLIGYPEDALLYLGSAVQDEVLVLAEGYEPRLSVERFHRFNMVFRPGVFDLSNNAAYIIKSEQYGIEAVLYNSEPSRFSNFWNPDWNDGPRSLGSFPFMMIGQFVSLSMGENDIRNSD